MRKPIYYPVESKTNGYIDYNDVEKILTIEDLYQENKQLKDKWIKLKKYIKTEIPEDLFIDTEWFVSILDKMQELEGSDSNE